MVVRVIGSRIAIQEIFIEVRRRASISDLKTLILSYAEPDVVIARVIMAHSSDNLLPFCDSVPLHTSKAQ
ncbi:hypothetical protein RIF29_27849 [Crotalaria pallida]|uniref:Uncharacterized protein n=1 Tax=Crotalaria pallida TaxID=3830 RepID=A0AAN9I2R4_CROPI